MRMLVIAIVVATARLASADVVIEKVGVEIAPTDPRGKPWDRDPAGADPDPRIDISIRGHRIKRCDTVKDSLVAECTVPERAPSAEPIELELHVGDVDAVTAEAIGTAHGTIAADADGRVELAAGGKLVKAWTQVRRRAGFWVSSSIAWPIGAGTGAALALLVYAIFRRRYLTPGVARELGKLDRAVGAKTATRFWRSPVLLTGVACGITAVVLAAYVRGAATEPLVAAIPLALGAFAITGTVIDAFVHEHLGATRARVLGVGVAASAAVPVLHSLDELAWLFTVILGVVILAAIVWSVLDSL
jgi:hypothetical protein